MSGLSDLGASIRAAIEQIKEAQGAGGLLRDRADEATRQLGVIGDGSSSNLIAEATTNVIESSLAAEEILGMLVSAANSLETYLGARGL